MDLADALAWLDGHVDLRRVADDVELAAQLGLYAGQEQVVVVDHEHPRPAHRFITSSTSVPSPGTDVIVAVPRWRAMRPLMESLIPW